MGKRNISRERRKRRLQIAEKAASRTLNGNGASPDLPPLPVGDFEGTLDTLFSHRYGALPYGNIYFSSSPNDEVRQHGLGPSLVALNDDQIISFLQFLDGKSLSNTIQCSRYLYLAGHHDELWRDLTLRKYGKCGFSFMKSWKDTFVSSELKLILYKDDIEFKPHIPIRMKNIYSDTFFRSWLCRNFKIQELWTSVNNVQTVDSKSLTIQKFLEYEESNTPLLIKGATSEWPAVKKWNRKYLNDQSSNVNFRATSEE